MLKFLVFKRLSVKYSGVVKSLFFLRFLFQIILTKETDVWSDMSLASNIIFLLRPKDTDEDDHKNSLLEVEKHYFLSTGLDGVQHNPPSLPLAPNQMQIHSSVYNSLTSFNRTLNNFHPYNPSTYKSLQHKMTAKLFFRASDTRTSKIKSSTLSLH